jgi:hypothetical protein
MLSETRKFKLFAVLLHRMLDQFPDRMRSGLQNVEVNITFDDLCAGLVAGLWAGAPPHSVSLHYVVPAANGRTRTASTEVKGIAYDVAHGLGGDGSHATT